MIISIALTIIVIISLALIMNKTAMGTLPTSIGRTQPALLPGCTADLTTVAQMGTSVRPTRFLPRARSQVRRNNIANLGSGIDRTFGLPAL